MLIGACNTDVVPVSRLQVCPLIWCGMCYSLGTKFRQSLFTNIPMIGVWGTIFLIYFSVLLAVPGKFTA